MKKINTNIKFIYTLIIFSLIINFLSKVNVIPKVDIIMPIIWFVIFILGIIITRCDYNHYYNIKNKIYNVLILLIIYFMLYFSLGLIFGYSYNIYQNNSLIFILKNIYLYIVPIIFLEYIRGILCSYSNKNNIILFLISIIFILIDIEINSNIFNSGETVLKYLCINIFPLISTEFLLTYLCNVGSYKLSLLYKILFTSYLIFMPILPNLNFFIDGMIKIIFPFIVYFDTDSYYKKEIEKVYVEYRKNRFINYIPTIMIVLVVILNYFNLFKYSMISILSNSMNPLYYKGDTVIIKKLTEKEKDKIKVGDIISYIDSNDNLIIHRVYSIDYDNKKIITKGDNNANVDSIQVSYDSVLGKYIFHIKYIGLIKSSIYDILNN